MMRYLLAGLVALALAACGPTGSIITSANTPVTAEQAATARDVSHGLEASYGLALSGAIAWGSIKTCGTVGAAPPPGCKTLDGMRSIESVRVTLRFAIDRLNTVIADTTATSSQLSTAIRLAREAYAGYQAVAAANQVKG